MSSEITLKDIVAPVPIEMFFRATWGKRAAHMPGWPGRFSGLLTWSALNGILRTHSLEPPRLRLVKEGKSVPIGTYMRSAAGRWQLDAAAMTAQIREGASLVLDQIQELHEPIAHLARAVERELQEPTNVNLYAGWRTANAFDLHWDGHEALVLQVVGRKRWAVYGPDELHPLTGGRVAGAEPPSPPVWSGILEAGDTLYIPRGWWHVAFPINEPSLHLTFGVRVRTGLDLLAWLSQRLKESAGFRADLPRFATGGERHDHVERLKAELLMAWDDGVIERFFEDEAANVLAPANPGLPWTALPAVIPPSERNCAVALAVARSVTVVSADGGRVEILANGRRWRFAEPAGVLVAALAEAHAVSIEELRARVADTIDDEQFQKLMRKLVGVGLIEIRDDMYEASAPPVETTPSLLPSA